MTTYDALNEVCLETRLQEEIYTTSTGTFVAMRSVRTEPTEVDASECE